MFFIIQWVEIRTLILLHMKYVISIKRAYGFMVTIVKSQVSQVGHVNQT